MTVAERVAAELANAMRARDPIRLSALRLLKTALTNKGFELGHTLSEAESVQVVQTLAKQRRDSIEAFEKAGRPDRVADEQAELAVLETYLPPPVDAAELEGLVDAAVAECGATSTKDLGRVMKTVMARLAGRAVDGKTVNELVRRKLAG